MSSSRDRARDLRYGRRGGRWATDATGKVDEILDTFDRLRQSSDDWPDLSDAGPGALPAEGAARMAHARARAGLELTRADRAALRAFPRPASGLLRGELLEELDPQILAGPGAEGLAPGPPRVEPEAP